MKIVEFIKQETTCANLESSGKMDVLGELSSLLEKVCSGITADQITTLLIERERLATTGIGEGVAIPHAKIDNIDSICAAIGISRTGIQFDAVDGQPVHIFIALLAPQNSTGEHLKALARISRILKDPIFRSQLREAKTSGEVYDAILKEDGKY